MQDLHITKASELKEVELRYISEQTPNRLQ